MQFRNVVDFDVKGGLKSIQKVEECARRAEGAGVKYELFSSFYLICFGLTLV